MNQKTALVTGGTAGVGLSIVRALAKQGTFVHFIGTNEDKGKRVEEELNISADPTVRFVQLDLSRLRAVHDFSLQFGRAVPALDVLVNVAGVMLAERQVTEDGYEKTFAIDHLAAFILCQGLRPALAAAQHGRIVNVSGAPSQLLKQRLDFADLQLEHNYTLMRAALNAVHAKTVMTEILAERFRDEIDVNAFHPGAVKSDLFRHMRFPMSTVFRFARRFMASESKSGIYASTTQALNGVTGQLFVGTRPRQLSFEQSYKDKLWHTTEQLVNQVLPGNAGHRVSQ